MYYRRSKFRERMRSSTKPRVPPTFIWEGDPKSRKLTGILALTTGRVFYRHFMLRLTLDLGNLIKHAMLNLLFSKNLISHLLQVITFIGISFS
jgi:hypothetical protein